MQDRQPGSVSTELKLPDLTLDPMLAPGFFILPPEDKITFALPTLETFNDFNKSEEDSINYTLGVTSLLATLKTWADKNSVTSTENIDEFIKNITTRAFVNVDGAKGFSTVYSEGLQTLYVLINDVQSNLISVQTRKEIIQILIQSLNSKNSEQVQTAIKSAQVMLAAEFEIKFPLPNVEAVKPFLATDDGSKYILGVTDLLEKLRKWAVNNEIEIAKPDPLMVFFEKMKKCELSKQDSKEYNQIYVNGMQLLAKILKKIHSESIPIAKRKDVAGNLIASFDVCGPGVYTHLEDADAALSSNLANVLKLVRVKISRAVIEKLRDEDRNWDVFSVHPGMEIHQVNTVTNQYANQLGIPNVVDGYAFPIASKNHFLYELTYVKFPERIKESLTTEAIISQLIGSAVDDIKEILANINNDNIENIKDTIKAALTYYGKDETFDAGQLINLNEDAYMEGRLELLPEKIKNDKEIELILTVSLLQRLQEQKYIDLSNVSTLELKFNKPQVEDSPTVYIPDSNNLKLAYVMIQKPPAPVIPLITYLPHINAQDLQLIITNARNFSDALLYLPESEKNNFIDKIGKEFITAHVTVSDLINFIPLDTHQKILGFLDNDFFFKEKEKLDKELEKVKRTAIPKADTYISKKYQSEKRELEARISSFNNYIQKHISDEDYNKLYSNEYNTLLEMYESYKSNRSTRSTIEILLTFVKGDKKFDFIKNLTKKDIQNISGFKYSIDSGVANEELIQFISIMFNSLNKNQQKEFIKLPAIKEILDEIKNKDERFRFIPQIIVIDRVFLDYYGADYIAKKCEKIPLLHQGRYFYSLLSAFVDEQNKHKKEDSSDYLKKILALFNISKIAKITKSIAYNDSITNKLGSIIPPKSYLWHQEIFQFIGKENLQPLVSLQSIIEFMKFDDEYLSEKIKNQRRKKSIISLVDIIGKEYLKTIQVTNKDFKVLMEKLPISIVFMIAQLLNLKKVNLDKNDLKNLFLEASKHENDIDNLDPELLRNNRIVLDNLGNFLNGLSDKIQAKALRIIRQDDLNALCGDLLMVGQLIMVLGPTSKAAFSEFLRINPLKPADHVALIINTQASLDFIGISTLRYQPELPSHLLVKLFTESFHPAGTTALNNYHTDLLRMMISSKNINYDKLKPTDLEKIVNSLNMDNFKLLTIAFTSQVKSIHDLVKVLKGSTVNKKFIIEHMEPQYIAKLMLDTKQENFNNLAKLLPAEKYKIIMQHYEILKQIESIEKKILVFTQNYAATGKSRAIINDTLALITEIRAQIGYSTPLQEIVKFICFHLENQFNQEKEIFKNRLFDKATNKDFIDALNSDPKQYHHERFLANILQDIYKQFPSLTSSTNGTTIKAITLTEPLTALVYKNTSKK